MHDPNQSAPKFNDKLPASGHVAHAFTAAECDRIVALGLQRAGQQGEVQMPDTDSPTRLPSFRRSSLAWLAHNAETTFIFERLQRIARQINDDAFKFDLAGFGEPLQFTRYEAGGDYYTWHQDLGPGRMSCRKLSMVLQLSDPAGYEGCELQLYDKGEPASLSRERGSLLVFPSYQLHRVTPLTKGLRYSLVSWIWGREPFR